MSDINKRYRPTPRPDAKGPTVWIVPSEEWPDTPDGNVSVTAPNPYGATGRTMTSALAATLDRDVSGYALTTMAGTLAADPFPVVYARPSGATVHHGRTEQGEALAHHETRQRRSRKGRSTFDVLAHHKRPRPVTDTPSGFDGLDSLGLIALADDMLRAAGVAPDEISGSVPRGQRASYLLGTDASSSAWAQLIRDDRSAIDTAHVANHHGHLLSWFPQVDVRVLARPNHVAWYIGADGVAHAGAVRTPGSHRAAWRGTYWRTTDRLTEAFDRRGGSNETSVSWPRRLRIRGRIRGTEIAQGWRRIAPGAYVRETRRSATPVAHGYGALARFATGTVTECLAWDADPDRAWHGFKLTARPVTARKVRGRNTPTSATRQRDRVPVTTDTVPTAEVETLARRIRDAGDRPVTVPVGAGALTVVRASQGRLSATLVRPSGVSVTLRTRRPETVAAWALTR